MLNSRYLEFSMDDDDDDGIFSPDEDTSLM